MKYSEEIRRGGSNVTDIFDEGSVAAIAGEAHATNPYRRNAPSWKYLVWMKGFRSQVHPNPECRACHGSGKCEYLGPDGTPYSGSFELPCFCALGSNGPIHPAIDEN
ncbi:MAG: hypothetical protein P1V97_23410 [Planctomycetota bacterium]|nr:hypothetical protein [Planctomycetota bacterium]